jgi:uncharacterized protein with NAD-binding domain and iron-sulfur cluster
MSVLVESSRIAGGTANAETTHDENKGNLLTEMTKAVQHLLPELKDDDYYDTCISIWRKAIMLLKHGSYHNAVEFSASYCNLLLAVNTRERQKGKVCR